MIGRIERLLHRLRRGVSRSEHAARLLKLPRRPGESHKPGLVLIQIDGLSRPALERAMRTRRAPFLRSLLKREHYKLHSHYSGVPSTTPAVQAELFYGVKAAVPAFSFLDSRSGRVVRMFDYEAAAEVQARVEKEGPGLLQDGASYSNIYSGGAAESHFCPATFGWGWLLDALNPISLALMIVLHAWSVLRILFLLAVEFCIALYDMLGGLLQGESFKAEAKFVLMRALICILMRELVVVGSKIDLARGLPVVHMNFIGYDEQAHRRGPGSAFAMWSVSGVDSAIRRVVRASRRSALRDYEVWIYSDHGQEETVPYPVENGRTVQEAILAVFGDFRRRRQARSERSGEQSARAKWLRRAPPAARKPVPPPPPGEAPPPAVITAMGPVGHVYPAEPLAPEDRDRLARRLVAEANIPLVLAPEGEGSARAWTSRGVFILPEDAAEILGPDHPFLEEAANDLAGLCRHPDAGELVVSGWRREGKPVSFPLENGSHAGPGPVETHGFALLPADAPVEPGPNGRLRPIDLRRAALRELGRPEPELRELPVILTSRNRAHPGRIRLMTYNVHSCVGMDSRHSPERIARVIARANPDIVALQEIDQSRPRTGGLDQAHEIARRLEMECHFHPAIEVEEERYGDALLSRFPMRLIRKARLGGEAPPLRGEPRGALWAAIDAGGLPLHVINTHLGLTPRERRRQVDDLLGDQWLRSPLLDGPAVLCGDFNALPAMRAYRRIARRMKDAQRALDGHRPRNTWFGRIPLGRIDHVFVSEGIEIHNIEVVRSGLALRASDHLPLIVDLEIKD